MAIEGTSALTARFACIEFDSGVAEFEFHFRTPLAESLSDDDDDGSDAERVVKVTIDHADQSVGSSPSRQALARPGVDGTRAAANHSP